MKQKYGDKLIQAVVEAHSANEPHPPINSESTRKSFFGKVSRFSASFLLFLSSPISLSCMNPSPWIFWLSFVLLFRAFLFVHSLTRFSFLQVILLVWASVPSQMQRTQDCGLGVVSVELFMMQLEMNWRQVKKDNRAFLFLWFVCFVSCHLLLLSSLWFIFRPYLASWSCLCLLFCFLLQDACREIGRCPTGEAVITPGFKLPATHVVSSLCALSLLRLFLLPFSSVTLILTLIVILHHQIHHEESLYSSSFLSLLLVVVVVFSFLILLRFIRLARVVITWWTR